jgi:hypothetical protein
LADTSRSTVYQRPPEIRLIRLQERTRWRDSFISALLGDSVEALSVDNSVLEVHPDNAEVENPSDVLRKPASVSLYILRYRQLDRNKAIT